MIKKIKNKSEEFYKIRVYVKDVLGNEKRIWLKEKFYTKADAEKAEKQFKESADRPAALQIAKLTVQEFLDQWLEDTASKYNDPYRSGTLKNHLSRCQHHIIPVIGKIRLKELNRMQINKMFEMLKEKNLSERMYHHIYATLRQALNTAVRWDFIDKNPILQVNPPKVQRTSKPILTEEQLKVFLDSIKDHEYYICFFIASTTGMRASEITNLKNDDVDLKNKCFYVRDSDNNKKDSNQLKTKSSRRRISMLPGTDIVIANYAKNKKTISEWFCCWQNPVKPSWTGKPFPANSLSVFFRKTKNKLNKELNLKIKENTTFHSLRHTHASILFKNGVDLKIVSERLGHNEIGITADTYTHFINNDIEIEALKNVVFLDNYSV